MLSNLLKGLFNRKSLTELNLKKLPSQGLFYSDEFKISIKKADVDGIIYYKHNYKDDPLSVIWLIKKIVKNNIHLTKGYKFEDISSIDIVFIFLEIVKLTTNNDIIMIHTDDVVTFDSDHFNYFNIDKDLMDKYDRDKKEFVIDDFRFKLPTIGVEGSVTKFITESASLGTLSEFSDKSYDFMYFLGDRTDLSYDDIVNLITIFNDELGDKEMETISNIMENFSPFNKYTLKSDSGRILDVGKLDLSKIWD